MFTIESLAPVLDSVRGASLTIGNFDGVHRGHLDLIRRLRRMADQKKTKAIALTFDPHPIALLRPERSPIPLTGLDQKVSLLLNAGLDAVGVFKTGPWLLNLTAREFFDRVIQDQFGATGLVEGPTFGFGRDRSGTVERLRDWCIEAGISLEIAPPLEDSGKVVSSTLIRQALADGRTEDASLLLGRPYQVSGIVVRGEGRGRTIGFPTANLSEIETLIPADGVYATFAYHNDVLEPIPSATHIGPNITFGASSRTVEAHLLDYSGDLYGSKLKLEFIGRIRPTIKFDGLESLLEQMSVDIKNSRELLSRIKPDC